MKPHKWVQVPITKIGLRRWHCNNCGYTIVIPRNRFNPTKDDEEDQAGSSDCDVSQVIFVMKS